nr:hypothetical protein [Pseudomonas sp. PS01300]
MRVPIIVCAMAPAGRGGRVDPQVPCRSPEVSVRPWAAASLRRSDSLEVKVRALLAERRPRIGYEKELVAANSGCR